MFNESLLLPKISIAVYQLASKGHGTYNYELFSYLNVLTSILSACPNKNCTANNNEIFAVLFPVADWL